jgi:hypothetical protein
VGRGGICLPIICFVFSKCFEKIEGGINEEEEEEEVVVMLE